MSHITDYYALLEEDHNGIVSENQIPLIFTSNKKDQEQNSLRVLSLFSGCGGMDIGFEGGFVAHRKSFSPNCNWIDHVIDDEWIYLVNYYGQLADSYISAFYNKYQRVMPENVTLFTGQTIFLIDLI